MKVLQPFVQTRGGPIVGYHMQCPGCNELHAIYIKKMGSKPCWGFDGNEQMPTFTPSLLVTWDWGEKREKRRCHSFIRNGNWQFLNDCTHHLSGKTVPMIEVPE